MWIYPAFAIASVALYLITIRWSFGTNRSGLPCGDLIGGLFLVIFVGAPMTLVWLAGLGALQKVIGWNLLNRPFVISLVVIGSLQWIIWSQILAFLISTFVFSG